MKEELTMQAAPPAEREVEVTVTLIFKESDLREWNRTSSLARNTAQRFYEEIVRGADQLDPYGAMSRLS